jgi:hypothetical protein
MFRKRLCVLILMTAIISGCQGMSMQQPPLATLPATVAPTEAPPAKTPLPTAMPTAEAQAAPDRLAGIEAEPWPEADALFRSDQNWVGSDDAYSIDLGNGRVLWLFGDTFITYDPRRSRQGSIMIRNSIAVQTGYDPSTAQMDFYWPLVDYLPRSFFPERGDLWYWPGHGVRLEDRVIVFLMVVRKASGGLGFATEGWAAVKLTGIDGPPEEWELTWLDTPANDFGVLISGGAMREGDYVYVYSVQEPSHDIYLVRWPVTEVLADDLARPQWWTGDEVGWVVQGDLAALPAPLYTGGQTEFTVHHDPALQQYLGIQTVGFPQADLAFRLAPAPTGPWSAATTFHRPEEYDIEDVMIYAGKAHPELEGEGADLILTYATNSLSQTNLMSDNRLYYPRFLKAHFR